MTPRGNRHFLHPPGHFSLKGLPYLADKKGKNTGRKDMIIKTVLIAAVLISPFFLAIHFWLPL